MIRKRFSFVLVIAFLLPFMSCQKDSDIDSQFLVGTWKLSYIETEGMKIPASSMEFNLSVTFNSSGTWSGRSSGLPINFGSGTYTLSGKTITIYESGDTYQWQIRSLTNDELVVDWILEGADMTWGYTR